MIEIDVKTILRLGLAAISLGHTVIAFLIAAKIGNQYFKQMATKLVIAFLMFFSARLIAAYIDYNLAFEIGWFSSLITYCFQLLILYIEVKFYLQLFEKQYIEIHNTDTEPILNLNPKHIDLPALSDNMDNMWKILRLNITKTGEVLTKIEKMQG